MPKLHHFRNDMWMQIIKSTSDVSVGYGQRHGPFIACLNYYIDTQNHLSSLIVSLSPKLQHIVVIDAIFAEMLDYRHVTFVSLGAKPNASHYFTADFINLIFVPAS